MRGQDCWTFLESAELTTFCLPTCFASADSSRTSWLLVWKTVQSSKLVQTLHCDLFLNVLNTHEWSESNALLLTYIHVELLFSFLYFHFTSVALHDWSYCASQLTDFLSLTNKRTDQLPWHARIKETFFVQHSNWGESWALGSQGWLLHTLTSIFETLILFDVTDHYWPLLTFAVLFLWVGKQWYKKSLTPN